MSEEEKINQLTDEGHSSTENKSPDGETTVVNKEQQTENLPAGQKVSTLQTKEMEVHHHPHVEKKNFKEYFLEFLMIFLAVTMGFFAENIREHIGEHKKENEYIKRLIEDWQTDTVRINEAIKYNDSMAVYDKALIRLLYGSKTDTANLKKMYELYPASLNFDPEFYDSRTFDLLKNNGDLKLIKNETILTKMSAYYRLVSTEKIYNNEIQTLLVNTYNLSHKSFDNYAFNEMPERPLSLITTNDETIKEYANYLYLLVITFKEYDRHLLRLKSLALELIRETKKQYHLENE